MLTQKSFKFQEFKFSEKKKVTRTQVEQDLKKLRLNVKAAILISSSTINIKLLLKVIESSYDELLKTDRDKRKELITYLYDKFITKYGLKKVTERNIVRLMSSCIKYKEVPKVRLFARFLKMFNALGRDDMLFYLDFVDFIRTVQKDYSDTISEVS